MADSISIGGITIRLISFQERAREYRGDVSVSFGNQLADGRDRPRRVWDGTGDWITPSEEATLRAVIEGGAVVCTGLVLNGESVLCIVTLETAARGPDVQSGPTDYTAINVAPTLTLREA